MKAKFNNAFSRKNEKGQLVDRFSYVVSFATPEEKEKFKSARGQYYKENENGEALWTSTRFVGVTVELKFTFDGSGFFADNTESKKYESLANQFSGQLGAAMADKISTILLASYTGKATATPVAQPAPVVISETATEGKPEVLPVNEADEA